VTRSASRPEAHRRRRPATPWALLAVLLTGLVASLASQDLLAPARPVRESGPPVLADPGSLGPLVAVSGSSLRSARVEPGMVGVALVDTGAVEPFVDAASVLEGGGLSATWFVAGRTVLDRPSVVDAVRSTGSEIGVTGFTGGDLAALPGWRIRLELSATQAVLAARESITAPLLLLPAAPSAARMDGAALRAARTAAQQGYGLVLGVDPEHAAAGDVAVIPLDDRAAGRLTALLARLGAAGIRPTPVSELVGMDHRALNPAAGTLARANGWAVLASMEVGQVITWMVEALFWPSIVLLGLRAVVTGSLALVHARRRPRSGWSGPVTIIVPAYNEAGGIEATLRSLIRSRWPYPLWVIVVDDGSTDGTAEVVDHLRLPGVTLIRQPNAGKAAALNRGLAATRTEVVVMVDADTVFERGTIAELVGPLADPRVGAVSGNAKVLNRRRLIGRWQHIEYVMGFNLDRRMLAVCGAMTTIPGAVGAFRTAALRRVGGIDHDTLAEDTDVTIAVARHGWRVVYCDRAIAWTEAPSTVGDLWRQRYRWCYGTMQAAWKHRRAMLERRPIGLIGLPYAITYQFALSLLGPVVDVAALYGLATGNTEVVLAWLAFTAVHAIQGVVVFRLDHERLGPLWAAPLQQIFYRQLMYLVVIQSAVTALTGTRLRWHKLRRLGLAAPAGEPARI